MTLPEISGVLCIFTTRNPKTSALTNVRKKGPGLCPVSTVRVPLELPSGLQICLEKNPGVSALIRAEV